MNGSDRSELLEKLDQLIEKYSAKEYTEPEGPYGSASALGHGRLEGLRMARALIAGEENDE